MPVVNEHASSASNSVYITRPVKKRACEQCNTSKVKCDSQLPCREYYSGLAFHARKTTTTLTATRRRQKNVRCGGYGVLIP
jgi:hypothetical protein